MRPLEGRCQTQVAPTTEDGRRREQAPPPRPQGSWRAHPAQPPIPPPYCGRRGRPPHRPYCLLPLAMHMSAPLGGSAPSVGVVGSCRVGLLQGGGHSQVAPTTEDGRQGEHARTPRPQGSWRTHRPTAQPPGPPPYCGRRGRPPHRPYYLLQEPQVSAALGGSAPSPGLAGRCRVLQSGVETKVAPPTEDGPRGEHAPTRRPQGRCRAHPAQPPGPPPCCGRRRHSRGGQVPPRRPVPPHWPRGHGGLGAPGAARPSPGLSPGTAGRRPCTPPPARRGTFPSSSTRRGGSSSPCRPPRPRTATRGASGAWPTSIGTCNKRGGHRAQSVRGNGDEGGQKSPMERARLARIPIAKHDCCSYFTHVSPDISLRADQADIALYTTIKSRHEHVQTGLKTRDDRARFRTQGQSPPPCGVRVPPPRKGGPTPTQVEVSVVAGNARAPRAFWIAVHGQQANSGLGWGRG